MRLNKTGGFTMIETLVAVLVLGLVVTASLKLTALSNRSLREARGRETLLREAGIIQIQAAMKPLDLFGSSGDVSWTVREKSSPVFDAEDVDIELLAFTNGKSVAPEGKTHVWRELEVTKNGKSVTLFLPKPVEKISSGDKS